MLALLCLVRGAWAEAAPAPALQQLAWKLDASGQASWQDMAATDDWQPFDKTQGWGFGSEAVWVRYRLRAALPGEIEPWVIKVSPLFLERLTLHDPAASLQLHAGLAIPRPKDSLDSVNFMFQIPALAQSREVYLRLETRSTRIIHTQVQPLRQAIVDNNRTEWLFGLLLSTSIVFALLSALQWIFTREKVMKAFAIKQLLASVWAFYWTGYALVLLGHSVDADVLYQVSVWSRLWTIAATLWFFLALIQDYKPAAVWIQIIKTFVAAFVALPALQVLGLPILPVANVLLLCTFVILLGALLASTGRRRHHEPLPRSLLLAYLVVYVLINSVPPSINLGLIPSHPIAHQLNLSHIVLDGLIMFLMLQLRGRRLAARAARLADRQRRIVLRLDEAQKKTAAEQRRREEQSRFLHMLMHELKTPLSIVSLALGARSHREEHLAHANRAVQDINSIIDRCVMADQTGEVILSQQLQSVSLPQLVHEQAAAIDGLAPRLELNVPEDLPQAHTDHQLLAIVVKNLLANAARYSDPLTPVIATIEAQDRHHQTGVSLRVCNVPGLAGWPDPQKLFSKYYRASGALRQSGSGLGLFLSRQLAQSLGGSLDYEPHPRHIAFVLWIPNQPL